MKGSFENTVDRFTAVPNEVVTKIFYYADIKIVENFLAKPLQDFLASDNPDEIKNFFLLPAACHLVNKRWWEVFLKMDQPVAKILYGKKIHFRWQRYSLCESELKSSLKKEYNTAHFQVFSDFINKPKGHKNYYFELLDPFYRINNENFSQITGKKLDIQCSERWSDFINLVIKYLPEYQKLFSEIKNDGTYNLWMLIALILVSDEKQIKLKHEGNNLYPFLNLFFHGPFPERVKKILRAKFKQNFAQCIHNALCFDTFEDIDNYECENIYYYFYNQNNLLKKTAVSFLKQKLLEKKLSEKSVSLLKTIYIIIFNLRDDKKLQDSLSDFFEKFFMIHDNAFLPLIRQIKTESFLPWPVFEKLYWTIENSTLMTFFKKYVSNEIYVSLESMNSTAHYPGTLLTGTKIKLLLSLDIKNSCFLETFKNYSTSFPLYYLTFFDAYLKGKASLKSHPPGVFNRNILFLNEIVFSLGYINRLTHEEIAQKLSLNHYVSFYKMVFHKLNALKKGEISSLNQKEIEKTLREVNPLHSFCDGTFLFEPIFELDHDAYRDMQKKFSKRLIKCISSSSGHGDFYKIFNPMKGKDLIKKIILLDKKRAESLADKDEPKYYLFECLPYLIKTSDDLKKLIDENFELVTALKSMREQYQKWISTITFRHDLQKTMFEFLFPSHFTLPSPELPLVNMEPESQQPSQFGSVLEIQVVATTINPPQQQPRQSLWQWIKQRYRSSSFLSKLLIWSIGAIGFVKVAKRLFTIRFLCIGIKKSLMKQSFLQKYEHLIYSL